MNKYNLLANCISISRIVLMLPFVILFYQQQYLSAMTCALIAVATDYFDGLISRLSPHKSQFGSWIDPLADACVMLTVLVLFTYENKIPLWFFIWVILRYIAFIVIALVQKSRGTMIQSSIWNKVSVGFFAGYFFSLLLSYTDNLFTYLNSPLLGITCILQIVSVYVAGKNIITKKHT